MQVGAVSDDIMDGCRETSEVRRGSAGGELGLEASADVRTAVWVHGASLVCCQNIESSTLRASLFRAVDDGTTYESCSHRGGAAFLPRICLLDDTTKAS